jgi:hypothetical protein
MAEFGHEIDTSPAPVAEVVNSQVVGDDPGGRSSNSTAVSDVEAVTVQFSDMLTPGALQEAIEVTVDGAHVGTLNVDVDAPHRNDRVLGRRRLPRLRHGRRRTGSGRCRVPCRREGMFDAHPGSLFDLIVTDTGDLSLSRPS